MQKFSITEVLSVSKGKTMDYSEGTNSVSLWHYPTKNPEKTVFALSNSSKHNKSAESLTAPPCAQDKNCADYVMRWKGGKHIVEA